MSRIRLSGCILIAIVSLCIFSAVYVRRSCLGLLDTLSRVEVHAGKEEYAAAAKAAAELNDDGSRLMPRLNMLVSSDKLTQIGGELSRLTPLIDTENDELGAELAESRTLLEQLYYGEIPLLSRLF